MFCVVYEWRVKSGKENQFREIWRGVTEKIYETNGSLGSRLHRNDDGLWVAYAQWPDRETWERFNNQPGGIKHFESVCHEIKTSLRLAVTDDLLYSEPFRPISINETDSANHARDSKLDAANIEDHAIENAGGRSVHKDAAAPLSVPGHGAIKELETLLASMEPKLHKSKYVFCTVSEEILSTLAISPLCLFREEEGVTLIVEEQAAKNNRLSYTDEWSLITCNVTSDLAAVGFLAAISNRLANAGIATNVVSAFHHDHLLVPAPKGSEALTILQELSSEARTLPVG